MAVIPGVFNISKPWLNVNPKLLYMITISSKKKCGLRVGHDVFLTPQDCAGRCVGSTSSDYGFPHAQYSVFVVQRIESHMRFHRNSTEGLG